MEQLNNVRPIVKPVSTATKPSQLGIENWFYHNGSHLGRPIDLIQEPFGNLAGYTIFPMTSGFKNNPSYHKEGWHGLMDFSYSPTVYTDANGDTWAVVRTSNRVDAYRIEDLLRYGAVDNPDNSANRFTGWLRATEGPHAIEYVKPNQEIGLFEFPEHTPNYSKYGMTDIRVPIKDLEGLVPINMVGKYISLIANVEQALRNIIYKNYVTERAGFNPVTEAWIAKLLEYGLGPAREIEAIGVSNYEREGMAAGTILRPHDKAILAASKNIDNLASIIAKTYGLSGPEGIKFVKESLWRHELFHVFDRRKGRSIDETEAEIGDLLAEFYKEMAETRGERYARYYRALAKFNSDYAEDYRKGRVTQEGRLPKSAQLEALINKYISEAERLGLKGEEAGDYVASRLEKEAGATKSAGSKGNRSNGKGKDSEAEEKGKGNVYERSELNVEEAKCQENGGVDAEASEGSSESSD